MPLAILIVIASICYAAFSVAYAKSGAGINAYLDAALYNGVASVAAFITYLAVRAGKSERLLPTMASGVLYSLLSGLLIAVFSIIMVKIFARGGLAYVMPLVYGGAILLSILAARFLFKETVTPLQLTGTALVVLGIGIIAYSKFSHAA